MSDDANLIGVIDEGTKSARFVIFKPGSIFEEVCSHEIEIKQIELHDGWVEQDPIQILEAVRTCAAKAVEKLETVNCNKEQIRCIGITNQRETIIVWDKFTGEPLYNAIVWSDTRTEQTTEELLENIPDRNPNHFKSISGLPISSYFSAVKIKWLIENVPAVSKAFTEKTCVVGTIDTWLIWNLTGGTNGGLHLTDVTNASRTSLMNLDTLEWDDNLLNVFAISRDVLPEIRSSSEDFGTVNDGSSLNGITISGVMGNQQSSLLGQMCVAKGQTKVTYRNACFLMCNTGTHKILSEEGLVTTVAYKMGKDQPACYALEGSVAVGGTALLWLGNRIGLLKPNESSEMLASSVYSTGDVYFVPAINGLYAPSWKSDAKGIICGLTAFTTRNHLIRAALEAICFQTHDIVDAFETSLGLRLQNLKVDGSMARNNLLMQLQADLSGLSILRTKIDDTTALGVAYAAAHSMGIAEISGFRCDGVDDVELDENVTYDIFSPLTSPEAREKRYKKWKMAVDRSSHSYS